MHDNISLKYDYTESCFVRHILQPTLGELDLCSLAEEKDAFIPVAKLTEV